MILQALVQYYEDLLANGKITRPGWTSAKVSWALELDENGQLMTLHPLQQEEKRGKKTVLAPCQLQVPEQVKRSSGVYLKDVLSGSAILFHGLPDCSDDTHWAAAVMAQHLKWDFTDPSKLPMGH